MLPALFPRTRRRQVTVLRDCIADLERELQAARTDPVTGLPTRQHWTRLAQAQFPAATAVLLADVDDFKHVNDRYGHAVGDQVLAATAAILTESLADHHALIGRLGGDEFAAIITAAEEDREAFIDIDLIEKATRQGVIVPRASGCNVEVSLSAGVTFLAGLPDRSLSYALAAADLAMYAAKPEPGHHRLFHPVGETVAYHAATHGTPVLTDQPLYRVRHRTRHENGCRSTNSPLPEVPDE
jgi:diguanylate cyclase (GGDEF)-like protein